MKKHTFLLNALFTAFLLVSCSPASSKSGYIEASVSKYSVIDHPILDNFRQKGMPSTGNVKILVIPVCFSGENDPVFAEDERKVADKAFFGKASDTSWESLSSYYEKSSYGKLHITGTITDVYKDSRSSLEFEKESETADVKSPLLNSCVDYATTSLGINTCDYDSNKDGWIDVVELIYVTGQPLLNQGGNAFWWAMTSRSFVNTEGNVNKPVASRYFWAPYSLICPGNYGGTSIDTHVLIHETGHAMGLSDYYSYASGDDEVCPSGGIDMMDFNVGDHDAYSKMALGWVNPFVIDGSEESFNINLHSFSETGECVILRDTKTDPWNWMPYDEYLLLQYYTPTGVNEKDSIGYPEWDGKLGHSGTYETYGLQVFHVDARLFRMIMPKEDPSGSSGFTSSYVDTISDEQTVDSTTGEVYTASYIAANNTQAFSYDVTSNGFDSPNCLISIIPADGKTAFMSKDYKSSVGLMSNLFGIGEKYGSASFSIEKYAGNMTNGTKLNDGSSINYSFTVTSNDISSCVLAFSSKN